MPMPSRSSSEITHDILLAIKDRGGVPTRVMYGANMSWHPLQKKLALFLKKGWIVEFEASRTDKRRKVRYELTDLGNTVLMALSSNKEIVEGSGGKLLNQILKDLVLRIDELEERLHKAETILFVR